MIARLLFVLALSQHLLCHGLLFKKKDEECFEEMLPKYRCFSLLAPYTNTPSKPESPTKQQIQFKLYTSISPTTPQSLGAQDINSVRNSHFDASKKVAFIVHGFKDSSYKRDHWTGRMVSELLLKVPNVVVVDWTEGARGMNYFRAVANTRVVGAQTATLIETMERVGLNPGNVHLIGHSLGAHVMGYAGEKFTANKIGRITGLDPAGFRFKGRHSAVKLDHSDAAFVQIIHTDVKKFGGLGTPEVTGHVDMFPNGGKYMPGCKFPGRIACSHNMAFKYFTASINDKDFLAYPCASLDDYKKGRCTSCGSGCSHMGYGATPSPAGMFVLNTGDTYPY